MNQQKLLQTFTLANEFKEGDLLVGGTRDEPARKAARQSLAALRIAEVNKIAFVEDQVSETLARSLNRPLAEEISYLTLAGLKQILLRPKAANWVQHYRDGLSSETIAAVVKLMSNEELSALSHEIF